MKARIAVENIHFLDPLVLILKPDIPQYILFSHQLVFFFFRKGSIFCFTVNVPFR